MSLSKNQLKLVTSLHKKKFRQKEGLFIAEGVKLVEELLVSDYDLFHLFALGTYKVADKWENKLTIITDAELKKITQLKTPNEVLAVFHIRKPKPIDKKGLLVALDGVNDPGNLGTIIRMCDWFGITELICSKNTVDCYNHKVVQSTMGSITRVNITYVNLLETLSNYNGIIYTADMDGVNVYQARLPNEAVLVMGNEANGISDAVNSLVNNKLTIPQFGDNSTESLNVATATAILLSEFKREF